MRTTVAALVGVFSATCALAGPAVGQDFPAAGTRLRIMLERPLSDYRGGAEPIPEYVVASLVSLDTTSVVVHRPSGIVDLQLRFPTARVRRVEVGSTGVCRESRRGSGQCGAMGLLTGVTLGLITAAVWNSSAVYACDTDAATCDRAARERRFRHGGVGAVLGLWIGLTIGRERWTPVTAWPPAR